MRLRRGPPANLPRRGIRAGETYVAFRLVLTDNRNDQAFVNSLKSREELGYPPRLQIGETPEIARGISAYRTREAAVSTARKAGERGRNLGSHVAEVRLVPDQGFEIAEWGPPGHLTIWGDSLILALHVADIVAVEDEE